MSRSKRATLTLPRAYATKVSTVNALKKGRMYAPSTSVTFACSNEVSYVSFSTTVRSTRQAAFLPLPRARARP